MISAYSSGVPVRRLLDAIFGTSPATWICAKLPSDVKIKMPLGVSPNGNDFLPSGAVTSATTKFQVPTIWSFRLATGCAAAAQVDTASASKAAAIALNVILSPGNVGEHAVAERLAPRCRAFPLAVGRIERRRNRRAAEYAFGYFRYELPWNAEGSEM